jgi:hypothetical protein
LPEHLGLNQDFNAMYADDLDVWQAGKSPDEVAAKLEVIATRFTAFAKGYGLALNAKKTQLLYNRHSSSKYNDASNGGRLGSRGDGLGSVLVDGSVIAASETFELLGVVFDRNLSVLPQEIAVAKAARQRASLVARLSHHLPRGRFLRQLAMGLLLGKVSHALSAVTAPRLTDQDKTNTASQTVQVAFNDVSRSITGKRRTDRIRVSDLLSAAKIPSFNHLVTRSVAMEAWAAFSSLDGGDGARNTVGSKIFDTTAARPSRATSAGLAKVPLRGHDTLVSHAARIWNMCPALRLAGTRASAKKAAYAFAASVPL